MSTHCYGCGTNAVRLKPFEFMQYANDEPHARWLCPSCVGRLRRAKIKVTEAKEPNDE